MKIPFCKYQGTGNDFVIIDNRKGIFQNMMNRDVIERICNRKFGIGADGLILLELDASSDFKMIYFNADGNESSMCGNGGRCISAFAESLNMIGQKGVFNAVDGMHEFIVTRKQDENECTHIKLKMKDVDAIERMDDRLYLNTGSPHLIVFSDSISALNVNEEGSKIRYSERFLKEGTNVNFVCKEGDEIFLRTYERGVEAETLSCGTGATAAALAAAYTGMAPNSGSCTLKTLGGFLKVYYVEGSKQGSYKEVWLEGPAQLVFTGEIEL